MEGNRSKIPVVVCMEPAPSIGASLTSPYEDTHRRPDISPPIGAPPSWLPPPTFSEVEKTHTKNKGTELNICVGPIVLMRQRYNPHTTLNQFKRFRTDGVPRMVTGRTDGLTLGAKLTILPHPFIRRSALTTPPRRVPNISRLLFRSTAALSSNRTTRPSGRRTGFLHRTMTARRTSPRRTFKTFETACAPGEMGRARFTTQTISSPTPPQPLLTLFLSTLTHSTRRAPELSMTF